MGEEAFGVTLYLQVKISANNRYR